MIYQSICLC